MPRRAWWSVLLAVAIAACRSANPEIAVIAARKPTLVAFAQSATNEELLVDFRGEHAVIRDWCERAGVQFETVTARELHVTGKMITPRTVGYVLAQNGRMPRSLPGVQLPDRVIAEACDYFRLDAQVRATCIAMDR